MTLAIVLNQAGAPAGVPGFAREDLVTGVPVAISLSGGPFLSQLWSLVDKPVDLSVPAQSSAGVVAPTAAATTVQPIDQVGTYLLSVAVDSGQGLGATPGDNATITFYAGDPANPLAAQFDDLPRRVMAYLERNEHNVQSDPIFGLLGNKRGWAQEWLRWFGVVQKAARGSARADALVQLTAMGATELTGFNVASVTRTGVGTVAVAFTRPVPFPYLVTHGARGTTGGSCTVHNETNAGFVLERGDFAGALVDADFAFLVTKP